jgi:hypothetical protein
MINYSEFMAATISIKQILTHDKLLAVFNHFDEEQTNQITAANIVSTLKKMGRTISIEEIEEIMRKHDKSKDGIIQFEEFKHMLLEGTETPYSEKDENEDFETKLLKKPTMGKKRVIPASVTAEDKPRSPSRGGKLAPITMEDRGSPSKRTTEQAILT